MKRRIKYVLFTSIIILGLLGGCSKNSETAGRVTRGEWISMLTKAFDLDSYHSDIPCYSDVTNDSALFSSVQAAAEWEILSIFQGDKLEVDRPVTREEVASTAAIAAGFKVTEGQIDNNGDFQQEKSIEFAAEHGILDVKGGAYLTVEDCTSIIETAHEVYLTDTGEERLTAIPATGLVDLSNLSPNSVKLDGINVIFSSTVSDGIHQGNAFIRDGISSYKIGVGDTFITAPTAYNPWGVAYKAIAIEEMNGQIVVSVEKPTLEDLYEELDVHTTVSADLNNIIWDDNVSVTPVSSNELFAARSQDYQVNFLAYHEDSTKAIYLGQESKNSWSVELASGNCKKTWPVPNSAILGNDDNALEFQKTNYVYTDTPNINDFHGSTNSWERYLDVENKFSTGYKITGTLSIDTLDVTTDVQYKRWKIFNWEIDTPIPEAANLTISSDISANLKLEGNLDDSLKIGTIPITLPVPGLTVSVDIYLYADASGELQATFALSNTTKVEWSGLNLRKAQKSTAQANAQVAIDLNLGADISANLDAFGVSVMDAGAKVGCNLTTSAYVKGTCDKEEKNGITTLTYRESMNLKADFYVPVVILHAGGEGTCIGDLGLDGKWEMVSKDNGALHMPLLNREWVFWETTMTIGQDGEEIIDSTTVTQPLHTYATRFEEVNFVTYPTFYFDYPDGWTVTKEEVTSTSEEVVLTNDRGATVTYWNFGGMHDLTGPTRDINRVNVIRVADASFVPSKVQATDYSDLGTFMVAKLTITGKYDMFNGGEYVEIPDGRVRYALLPASEEGEREESLMVGLPTFSFWYAGHISLIADAPDGKFTEQEEKEVIAILSSFTDGLPPTDSPDIAPNSTEVNMAVTFDELWKKLKGTWTLEEYI